MWVRVEPLDLVTFVQAMHRQTRIAWSQSGLIAYINGQHNVYVTWLHCVDGENWDYVPPIHIQAAAETKPVHLSWSTTNSDLAVADELGRVHIVSISPSGVPKNQIVASAVRDRRQRPAELDRIVGLHWLRSGKSLIILRSAEADSSKPWESVTPLGPFHPSKQKSALVCVNGNGMLRLLVQTPDYQYAEVDALMPGAHFVSQARFVQNGPSSILIVVTTGNEELIVYEAIIQWKPDKIEQKQDFVEIIAQPVALLTLPKLGTLKRLAAFRMANANSSSAEVLVRLVFPHHIAFFTLQVEEEALNQSFFQLFNASSPVPPEPHPVWKLEQKDTITYEREILEYTVTNVVAVTTYTNGDVEREALIPSVSLLQFEKAGLQFDPLELVGVSNVSGIDAGNINSECKSTERLQVTDICFSPTTTCAAVFYSDINATMPKLVTIKPRMNEGQSEEELNIRAKEFAIMLATSYACTVFNSEQCDDIMLVSGRVLHSPYMEKVSKRIFLLLASESQRLLNVQLSAPEDPHKLERLVVIPSPSQRWLSYLIGLGTTREWTRTPGCHTALSLLHLQLLAFGLTWTLKRISQRSRAQNVSQLRLEIQASQFHLASMLGPVRWATDLILRITQELYDASSSATAKFRTGEPNVYISLLYSGVARYLLRYFLRGIRTLSANAKGIAEQETRLNSKISQAVKMAKDPALAQELRVKLTSPSNYTATRTLKKLVAQLQSMPMKLDAFEKILVSVDDFIKALVAKGSLSEDRRKLIDSQLITSARLPLEFKTLNQYLIETARTILFPATDVPTLYFQDTSWLGLEKVECGVLIDGLRKRVILPQEPVQLCTRCGMKSVATSDQMKQGPQWLVLFQRHCVCGGSWLQTPI